MPRTSLLLLVALAGCQAPAPVTPAGSPVPSPSPSAGISPSQLTGAFLFYEDFEKGSDRWALEGPSGDVAWRLLEAYACGGKYTMLLGRPAQATFTDAPGVYTLTLKQPIDLTKAVRPHLRYDLKGLATPASACVIQPEARAPGGDWTSVGSPTEAGLTFANTLAADMTAFAGKPVELRFKGTLSAATAPSKGMYLDDVNVIEPDAI